MITPAQPVSPVSAELRRLFAQRIVILEGPKGTMAQARQLAEKEDEINRKIQEMNGPQQRRSLTDTEDVVPATDAVAHAKQALARVVDDERALVAVGSDVGGHERC